MIFTLLGTVTAIAQPLVKFQPLNFPTTCQPNANTTFTNSQKFEVEKGTCGNNGSISFVWQYFNGTSWILVSNDTPAGFITYTPNSTSTGSGSNVIGRSDLSITLGANAATGTFQFRSVATHSGCPGNPLVSNTITFIVNPKSAPTFIEQAGVIGCVNSNYTYSTESGQSAYLWGGFGVLNTDYSIVSGSLANTSNTVTVKWLTTGNKTVSINYTNSNGCNAASPTLSTTTAVGVQPTPTFTSQPTANICASTDVIYTTQTGFSNYDWIFDGVAGFDYSITSGGTPSSNTVTLKWLTPGSKTLTVNYNNANGCNAALPASATTMVNERPTSTFTTFPGATTCANTDVTYTTQLGQSAYSWTVPGTAGVDYIILAGGIGPDNHTVTLQWLIPGSKTVAVNYNNADGCNAITDASSATTVSFAPIPLITADGPTTFCDGGSVTLTSDAAATYQWFNNGVIIAGATAQSYTASSSASYTVRVSNAAGCEAISTATAVTENPLPDITISSQSSSLCLSASSQTSRLDYTNTDNSPTTYSITWIAPTPGFADVIDSPFPAASFFDIAVPANAAAGTYTATLTVKNANGCASAPKTFSVLITSPPDASNFSLSATDGCAETGAVITINSATIGDGTYTVTYDLTGANTATGNTAVMIFSDVTGTFTASALNAGATNIMITQVALVGCFTPLSVNNTASFTINPLPVVAASTGPNSVCVNSTIDLDNTTGGTWSSSEPSIATVSSTGIVSGLIPGAVVITYTTAPDISTGCSNTTTNNITIDALPAVESIAGTTTLCISTTTNLNNNTAGGTWMSSNTAVAIIDANTGLVNAISVGTSTITYTTAINAAGCTNSTTVLLNVEPVPTVDAGLQIETCESATPSAITLSGASFGGSATSATWKIEAGGGILSNEGPTGNPSTVTYTPAANFNGTVTLSLTTNAPNSCAAVSATRTIEITEKPVVVPGNTIALCESSSPLAVVLTGARIEGGATTGAWSITSGGGSLSSEVQTLTPELVTYTPEANFTGQVTLTLTSNASGSCSPETAIRTINITAPPTATAGPLLNSCESQGAIDITPGAVATNYTSVSWETSGSGTFTNVTSLITATYTPSVADVDAGSITITLRASGGGCADATSTKTLNITKTATANAGSEIIICFAPGAMDITPGAVATNHTVVEWTSNGTGTITNPNSLTTATYTPGFGEVGIITLTLKATGTSPCADAISTKSLTINPDATIVLTSAAATTSQTPCINTAITNITYTIGGGGTGATFSGLPNGVAGNFVGGIVTINGTPTVSGLFNYTVTTTGTCAQTFAAGSIDVKPVSTGGTLSPALITGCGGTASGTITLAGYTGRIVQWEYSTDGGTLWTPIVNETATQTYSNLPQTTIYRALLQSGVCSTTYSSISVISVVPQFNPTTIATPVAICIGQTSDLTSTTGYPNPGISDEAGSFTDANPDGWRRDGQSTGSFLPANRDNATSGPWGETNGPKTFSGISYDGAGGKFAIVDGPLTSLLETPVFSLIGQNSSFFKFSQAYSLKELAATATIEISTDGGANYTNILAQYSGISSFGITGSTGIVQPDSISLANYIGLSNLRIRFRYVGGTTNSSWAIDNVRVPAALPITYAWTDPATIITDPTLPTVTVKPTITTTYTLTTMVNGCPAGASTVTVTVNPLPTITPSEATSGAVSICYSTASQNLPLPYSATDIPLPATFSITWGSSAISAGFINVLNSSLAAGSVGLIIPAGALPATYTGTITINNANGCASPEAPFSVIVKPLPVVSVPTPAPICIGASITLTASGASSYTWSPAAGLSATTGTSVTANPTVTTTYTVTGIDAGGCSNFTTVTVTVNPIATLGGVIGTPVCNGNTMTINLSGLLANSTSFLTYQIGASTPVNITGVSADASGAGNFTIPVSISDNGLTFVITSISSATAANAVSCAMVPASNNSTTLSVYSGMVWTGLGGNNLWSNNANWICRAPFDGESVTIPQVSNGNFPRLDVSFISNNFDLLGNATIELNGFTLTLGNAISSLLTMEGSIIGSNTSNLVINGTFNTSLKFDPTAPRISNALRNLTFNSVGNTINLANSLNMIGNVIPTAGTFASNGFLTMVSTASTTSNIGSLSGGADVSGVVNVESWLTGGAASNSVTNNANRGTRTMSSPVNDATTSPNIFKQLQSLMFITGTGTGGFDVAPPDPSNETLFTYKEDARYDQGALAQYNVIPDINNRMLPGIGFFIFYRGDRTDNATATGSKVIAPYDIPESMAVTYRGLINKGDTRIDLSYTANTGFRDADYNGFNLVGNPYPAIIDWTQIARSDNSIVENLVSIIRPGGSMLTYSGGIITNGGQGALPAGADVADPINTPTIPYYIQPGQGFYVRTRAAGSFITFKESSKVISAVLPIPRLLSNGPLTQTSSEPQVLRIKLKDKFNTDETAIVFKQGFDAAFGSLDATYLAGSSVSMASQTSDGKNVAINFMPDMKDITEIGLTVNSAISCSLKLNFSNIASLGGYRVFLKDMFLNSLTNIKDKPVYEFNADLSNPLTFGAGRFKLVFEKPPVSAVKYISFTGEIVKKGSELKWTTEHEINNDYFEVERSDDGVSFFKIGKVDGGGTSAIKLDYNFVDNKPASGINYYRLKQVDFKCEYTYSDVISLDHSVSANKEIAIYPNPAANEFSLRFDIMTSQEIQINIYDVSSRRIKSSTNRNFRETGFINQNISDLISGVYIVEVVDSDSREILKRLKLIKE